MGDLDFDMVAMAMGTVDRFLSRRSKVAQEVLRDRDQFRLVARAALSLCVETQEEGVCGERGLALLSSTTHTVNDIKNMELTIREDLRDKVHALTSLQIAHHFLSLTLRVNLEESRWSSALDLVRFQTEEAVRDYYFTTQLPSTLAIAAVLNVFDEVTGQDREIMGNALLRDLPVFISEHSVSLGDLLAVKERLKHAMEAENFSDDDTVVSETSTEILNPSSFGTAVQI